jgi:hypothetical protein
MTRLKSTSGETREQKKKEKDRSMRQFTNKIKRIFCLADFSWIDSENHQFKIGLREIELDAIFYYENIILICEYTGLTNDIKDHVRKNMRRLNKSKKTSLAFLSIYVATLMNIRVNCVNTTLASIESNICISHRKN